MNRQQKLNLIREVEGIGILYRAKYVKYARAREKSLIQYIKSLT